jgi:hypothetical protein
MGRYALRAGDTETASLLWNKQRQLASQLTLLDPENGVRWYGLSQAYQGLLKVANRAGSIDEAARHAVDGIEAGIKSVELQPDNGLFKQQLLGLLTIAVPILEEADPAFLQSTQERVSELELDANICALDTETLGFVMGRKKAITWFAWDQGAIAGAEEHCRSMLNLARIAMGWE